MQVTISQTMSEVRGVHVVMSFLSESKGNKGQDNGVRFAA